MNTDQEKFKNKYRIPSARLQNWDYGWDAAYFVTICTQNRIHYFGNMVETQCIASLSPVPSYKIELSEIGHIVENEWLKTFEMRPDMNLQMAEYVVMPNHFHAIIIIGENEYNTQPGDDCGDNCSRDAMHCVSTPNTIITNSKNKFGPQSKNLASIIRGFKSAVTINTRKTHADFAWQPRFHDHIIRNDPEYQRISDYIINNPVN